MFASVVALLCLLSCNKNAIAKFDDSSFLSWFGDELREVKDVKLEFDAALPSYVRGYMVQGGPGAYSMGEHTFTHAFDGFAKIHRFHFGDDGVTFSSEFLQSSFWTESKKENKITRALLAGDTIPSQGFGPKGVLAGRNDNNYVKCHKNGDDEMCLSDSSVAVVFKNNFDSLDYVIRPSLFGLGTNGTPWNDTANPFAHICGMGIMAHGKTNPLNGNFLGSVACISPLGALVSDYHIVYEIDPAEPNVRKVIQAIKMSSGRSASYMHSMAQTARHVVLIAQPLHSSAAGTMEGKALSEGAIVLGNGTIFQAVSLIDGSVREWDHPSFLFSHIQNSWEDGDDIVIELTWYEADWRMAFLSMFRFENLQKEKRDAWPVNKLIRYRLKTDGSIEETNLLPAEPKSLWELPVVDPRLHGKNETCVTWFIQGACNAYDEDASSTKVGPNGAYGLAKRNFCTGERLGWYAPNEYPSEVSFIPNPSSSEEDDGALVGIVFDGNKNTSYVHIRDARSLRLIARADLPVRAPFPVHATWFSDGSAEEVMLV